MLYSSNPNILIVRRMWCNGLENNFHHSNECQYYYGYNISIKQSAGDSLWQQSFILDHISMCIKPQKYGIYYLLYSIIESIWAQKCRHYMAFTQRIYKSAFVLINSSLHELH